MSGEECSLLLHEAEIHNLNMSVRQAEQLIAYYEELIETNKVMNLTRITDFRDAVEKHFIDSLMITRDVDLNKIHRVLDIGSGAGFPGLPLKILYPHLDVLMIDSVGKKMNFVSGVIQKLGLAGVEARHARAEELARDKKYRESFDLCVSRAVANLSTLSEYCLPFVKKGCVFAAYKSDQCEEEVRQAASAIRKLGGDQAVIDTFSLYGMGRSIITIKKKQPTPAAYPRKAGIPSKEPLS